MRDDTELVQLDVMEVSVYISEVMDAGYSESLFYVEVGACVPELAETDTPFAPGDSGKLAVD